MDALLWRLVRRPAAFTIIAIALAGCGGHSSSGTSASARPQGFPEISNLTAAYVPGTCTVQGHPGRPLDATVHYTDSDGDVKGGTLEVTGTFLPSQQLVDVSFLLPSNAATMTGTTDGSITAFACVALNGSTGLLLSVALLDKAGHSSNILSVEVHAEALRGRNHETDVAGIEVRRP